jgi:hypothetical protein
MEYWGARVLEYWNSGLVKGWNTGILGFGKYRYFFNS